MPDGSKGFDLSTPFNGVAVPQGAQFYDTKFRWYVKASAGKWHWFCWLTDEWVVIDLKYELPTYDKSFVLHKNPTISWEYIRRQVVSNKQMNVLRERTMERRRLPFIRRSRECIVTVTHCLSWPQRLYLCWFRGFNRDPDAPGFGFIKQRETRRAK